MILFCIYCVIDFRVFASVCYGRKTAFVYVLNMYVLCSILCMMLRYLITVIPDVTMYVTPNVFLMYCTCTVCSNCVCVQGLPSVVCTALHALIRYTPGMVFGCPPRPVRPPPNTYRIYTLYLFHWCHIFAGPRCMKSWNWNITVM